MSKRQRQSVDYHQLGQLYEKVIPFNAHLGVKVIEVTKKGLPVVVNADASGLYVLVDFLFAAVAARIFGLGRWSNVVGVPC